MPLPPRPPLDRALLTGAPWPVEVLDEAPSTNGLLADRARAGAPERVLVTEHQTAGRGRLARTWETPDRAALTFSLLLRPTVEAERWPWLPLLTGYAVASALSARESGLQEPVGVKWPNDVLVGERKVAGILAERVETPTGPAAVVGIGLNVTTTAEELPVATATSLLQEGAEDLDRTALLLDVLAELGGRVADWAAGGERMESLRRRFGTACVTVGRDVRVDLPGGDVLTGRADRVDDLGRLHVRGPAGLTVVGAGDVVHVRNAPAAPTGPAGG